ncbi:unnamed protein product [Amaranthus hypochondriacus]
MSEIISTILSIIEISSSIKEASSINGDAVESMHNELKSSLNLLKRAEDRPEAYDLDEEWLNQVRTLTHEIEDVIDEYRIYQKQNALGKLKYHILLKLRGTSNAIQSLHSKSKEIEQRKIHYSRLSGNSSIHVTNNIVQSQQHQHNDSKILSGIISTVDSELVGLETAKDDLIELLDLQGLEDSEHSMRIAVMGMRGLGKTTLVWSVYNDESVKEFFPVRAWISATAGPKNYVQFLKSMIKQLYSTANEHDQLLSDGNRDKAEANTTALSRFGSMDEVLLKEHICNYLKDKRYIVILDGVEDQTDHIDLAKYAKGVLPSKHNKGSKIVITTRYENVAHNWVDGYNHGLYKLKCLPQEKAWQLFCNKAFHGHGGHCPSLLLDVASEIVQKCEGLPLAISAMGAFLSTRSDDLTEWKKVQSDLGFYLKDYRNETYSDLMSIYQSLPYQLKPCFLYFGLFPSKYAVKRMRLIRLWIAEGFIEDSESNNLTLEDIAEEYIRKLVSLGLVVVDHSDNTGKPQTLRVNPLLYDLIIISKVKHLRFCQTFPNKISSNSNPRRLSMHLNYPASSNGNADPVLEKFITSNIKTLIIIDSEEKVSTLKPEGCLTKLNKHILLLKVLDLYNTSINKIPEEIESLVLLHYLSLRNTQVKTLPRSIGKLQELQTLDLKHTLIRELPTEINMLRKLRHLLGYSYTNAKGYSRHAFKLTAMKLPKRGLNNFTELQKLAFIDVGSKRNKLIKKLRKMAQLRRLGITGLKLEDGKDLCAAITEMKCLQSLSLYSETDHELDVRNSILPTNCPSSLKCLYLNGPLNSFPRWISELHCLVKLRLRWSSLHDDPLKFLGTLHNLVELQLLKAYEGETLEIHDGGFKKLRILHLLDLDNLKRLSIRKGALSSLELMAMGEFPKMQEVPLGIEYLSNLKALNIFNMPLHLAQSLQEGGQHHSVVKHVKNVYFQQFDQQAWGWQTSTL